MSPSSGHVDPKLRSIFISDVHLGYRGCRADYLLDFLSRHEADTIFMIGDIVDVWSLKRSVYWPDSHQEVVRTLQAKGRAGTRLVYIPGNHDEVFRDLCGSHFGHLEVFRDYIHETADGRQGLLLHGDEFDESVKYGALERWIGGHFYDVMLSANHALHGLRRRLGFGYWSLADWLKRQAPQAVEYIGRFEEAAAAEARRRGVDGVICGHIHRPALRDVEGVLYCNDGDWVESCTALVEDRQGRLSIMRWTEGKDLVGSAAPKPLPLDRAA